MSDIAIRVENLSKLYRIGTRQNGYKTLRESITNAVSSVFGRRSVVVGPRSSVATPSSSVCGPRSAVDSETLWALKNVSFEVRRGEVVGIIGRNGAGKSTLLKILSRITEPTEGHAEIHGRVGSLLEVGTGFHPELTGRENIYLNGAILGMKKAEIDRKFDEIVAFSEIEKFIDTPVKHYSSGMYVRLAFAVAAHLDPEILLVDELLAVGDAQFQKKSLGKMGDAAREGRTVLFVSHNMRAITDLCDRCIWFNEGIAMKAGKPKNIVIDYFSNQKPEAKNGIITAEMHRDATGDVYFRRIALVDEFGKNTSHLFFGAPLRIQMELEVCRPVEGMRLIISIERLDGTLTSVVHHTDDCKQKPIDAVPGRYIVNVNLELPLMPGGYSLELGAKPLPGYWGSGPSWDWVPRALDFFIEQSSNEGQIILPVGGVVRPLAKWDIKRIEQAEF